LPDEVLGEVLFDQMLSYFQEPDQQYKISVMLQLETETKARLRPVMLQLELDIKEQEASRNMGLEMAAGMKGLSWEEAMTGMRDAVKPAIERYREIASFAPPEYKELAETMIVHEKSISDFAELELAGEVTNSADAIVAQLQNKLSMP